MALGELTVDNLMSQSAYVRMLALLGIFLLILLMAYFLLIKPRLAQLNALKKQQVELDKTYQADNKVVAQLATYQDELKSLQSIESTMQSQLTSLNEFSSLIEMMAKLAENNGLEVNLLKPAPEEKKGLAIAMPISLSVSGDYAHVAMFLNQCLSLKKIIALNELSIAPVADARYLIMKLKVIVYRYSGEEVTREGSMKVSDLSEQISGVDTIPLHPNPFELPFSKLNYSKEPLTAYALASLRMMGTIEKSGKIWALVMTEDQMIFRVSIGMRMGELEGKVVSVTRPEIKIMQTLQNGSIREVSLKIDEEETSKK